MIPRRVAIVVGAVGAVVALDLATVRLGGAYMVHAPNLQKRPIPVALEPHEQRIAVGPPAAVLSVEVGNPKLPPRATIFLLHAITDRKEHVRHWAERFNEAGYRTVLVDSRGHGRSTGERIGYGVIEARDLSQLLDALHFEPPIGVMGVSYGGATALQWAGHDPRIRSVVALASFASLREIMPVFVPKVVPLVGWLIPRWTVQRSVDHAGKLAGFDPDESSPRKGATATRAPILLIHGKSDNTVPYHHAEMILDGARDHVTLVPFPGQDHDHIAGDPRLWPLVLDWFARTIQ